MPSPEACMRETNERLRSEIARLTAERDHLAATHIGALQSDNQYVADMIAAAAVANAAHEAIGRMEPSEHKTQNAMLREAFFSEYGTSPYIAVSAAKYIVQQC